MLPLADPISPLLVSASLGFSETESQTPFCAVRRILPFGSPAFWELGRAREEAFRQMGEGTGRERDLDRYDPHYRHLILWDTAARRYAAAARLRVAPDSFPAWNADNFYAPGLFSINQTLFEALWPFEELGRMWVSPHLAASPRVLTHLWHLVDAELMETCQHKGFFTRHLVGVVGLSPRLPAGLTQLLLAWLRLHAWEESLAAFPLLPQQHSLPEPEAARQKLETEAVSSLENLFYQASSRYAVAVPPLLRLYLRMGVRLLHAQPDPLTPGGTDLLLALPLERLDPGLRSHFLPQIHRFLSASGDASDMGR